MKNLLFILGFITFPLLAGAQTTTKLLDKPDTTKKVLIVDHRADNVNLDYREWVAVLQFE